MLVCRRSDIGSPRASKSISATKAGSKPLFVSVRDLRPPPARRLRPASSGVSPLKSLSPRPVVLTAMPVARDTAAIPPRPAATASAAAVNRRPRSSKCGDNDVKRSSMLSESIMQPEYRTDQAMGIPQTAKIRFVYFLTSPWHINARNRSTGHLWQSRFGSVAMDEEHLSAAMAYVTSNPVRTRLVALVECPGLSRRRGGRADDNRPHAVALSGFHRLSRWSAGARRGIYTAAAGRTVRASFGKRQLCREPRTAHIAPPHPAKTRPQAAFGKHNSWVKNVAIK